MTLACHITTLERTLKVIYSYPNMLPEMRDPMNSAQVAEAKAHLAKLLRASCNKVEMSTENLLALRRKQIF